MKPYKQFTVLLTLMILGVIMFIGCNKGLDKDKSSLQKTDLASTNIAQPGSKAFCAASKSDKTAVSGSSSQRAVTQSNTVTHTDFTSAGVGGLRNVGSGVIALSGVSGTVTKAFLYWQGETNSTTDVGNPITVNSTSVTGTDIGYSNDNCWGYSNSQAYRADVTSLVKSTGNGNYNLSGFGAMNPNGASLIVFFDDGNTSNDRDVVLFDGNDSNEPFGGIPGNLNAPSDPIGWDVTLPGINYSSGSAHIEMHVADGQAYPDDQLVLNNSVLVPAGAVFDGNTVPSANNGPSNNGSLWDIRSFDITSFLSPGSNTLHLTTGVNGDCLGLIVTLIDLPAGTAPTYIPVMYDVQPQTCPNIIIHTSNAVLITSILGTLNFDVTKIDITTLKVNGISPIKVNGDDLAGIPSSPVSDCTTCSTAGPDGIRDMRLAFNTQAIVATLGNYTPNQCVSLTVTGKLLPAFGGTPITGTDYAIIK